MAGSFTQVEKYIYFLASDKERLENKLNSTFRDKIGNLIIKIVNPQGVIIAGRGNDMSELEKNDFEIVRKAHKDISEVITYDELITRLENTIMAFENKKNQNLFRGRQPPVLIVFKDCWHWKEWQQRKKRASSQAVWPFQYNYTILALPICSNTLKKNHW